MGPPAKGPPAMGPLAMGPLAMEPSAMGDSDKGRRRCQAGWVARLRITGVAGYRRSGLPASTFASITLPASTAPM